VRGREVQDPTTRYDLHSSNRSLSADAVRGEGYTLVKLGGKEYRVVLKRAGPDILEGYVNDKPVSVKIEEETESSITLTIDGNRMVFERPIPRPEREGGKSETATPERRNSLTSPMPGRVVALKVREGQSVGPGDPLMIVESMKMETLLTSDRNAVVGEVRVKEGEAIRRGQTLIVYSK
jgi:glutaconyl-CoA/methylmalonyl-CoA decarboxylase subunit gamma